MSIAGWFACVDCDGTTKTAITNGVTEITVDHEPGCPDYQEAQNVS